MTNKDPTDLRQLDREAETDEVVANEKRRRDLDDLRWLMAHPQGRRITTRILEQAGIYRTSFNHSGSVMAFNEGRRDIGLFIIAELQEAAPDGYLKLVKEYRANA